MSFSRLSIWHRSTRTEASTAALSAKALVLLGDVEVLFPLVQKTRSIAVSGILTGLKVRASNCPHSIQLDYRPSEHLFDMKSASVTRLVMEELEPGSSFIEIKPTDIDEAIRGLDSKYVVIRQHAVCVLGEHGLGKIAGETILPKLAERLHDKVSNFRRLTLLPLGDWKVADKLYHGEMRKLQKDKNADVPFWARYVFD